MTLIPESERNEQRLQKIVAAAGIASRRKAEELITSGRVQVNGQTVTELGSKADPERDHVRVDGKLLKKPQQFRYFMLNKPKGVVTTVSDPEGRPTVMKFFAHAGARVFPVGRLDYQSEGLLLMTNDGDLANVLTSAASQVEKTYLVKVSGKPTEGELEQLRRGVMIERGRRGEREGRVMTQPAKISLVRDTDNPWYEVVLTEGKNREIRKMFEEVGHFVEKVRRVGFGPLVLDVPPGETRELSDEEVTQLKRASRRRAASSEQSREQPRKSARRPRSGPAALPRPVRKRIKTRSSPSNK
jgi:23S rRNA pseudouridine2605 synthase